jgi:hypothetical protein
MSYTVRRQILALERSLNTVNGNPVWRVTLDDGGVYVTKPDAMFAFALGDSYLDAWVDVTIEGEARGRSQITNIVHLAEEAERGYDVPLIVHKAAPDPERDFHCIVCGQVIKQVPGGHGTAWVHRDSGAVAAPNPPKGSES